MLDLSKEEKHSPHYVTMKDSISCESSYQKCEIKRYITIITVKGLIKFMFLLYDGKLKCIFKLNNILYICWLYVCSHACKHTVTMSQV